MLLHPVTDSFTEPHTPDEGEWTAPVPRERSGPALSEAQVLAILEAKESPWLEFKRVSGKMVSKALETICAFANSDGGTLILGIADPRRLPARIGSTVSKRIRKLWMSYIGRYKHISILRIFRFVVVAWRCRCRAVHPYIC